MLNTVQIFLGATKIGENCPSVATGFRITIQPDSAIQNRMRIGLDFEKISTGSDMDIQTALITAVECLIRVFSDINRIGSNISIVLPD